MQDRIFEIVWDYDEDNIWDTLASLSAEEKNELLKKADGKDWNSENMRDEDLFETFKRFLHHNNLSPEQFFGLPVEVMVESSMNDDEVTDFLTDTYGFFIEGFLRSDGDMLDDEAYEEYADRRRE